MSQLRHSISFAEAFKTWVHISLLSFGGPAGQIAVMHRVLVEEKRWIGEQRFLHALNYCMLLPGPEAQQLMTYLGWLMHRTLGGLVAGTLFVVPGFLAILGLSITYALFQKVPLVEGIFLGLKPAVLAIVVQAVFRVSAKSLLNRLMVGVAAAAFVGIFFLGVPFPAIVLAAGLFGWLGSRVKPEAFVAGGHGSGKAMDDSPVALSDHALHHVEPSLGRTLRVLAIGFPLWFGPILGVSLVLGRDHILVQQGLFFSQLAVVTFGGAYAVLAYVAQAAVDTFGWVSPGEMLDGLGMAETTPGPLIMVLEFVGFLGAYRNPAPFPPLIAGVLAAIMTTWATFVPCFIWIFLGAPYIERLRGNKALSAGLSAITAAVVGVVLNLAVWFALHVAFGKVEHLSVLGLTLHLPVWSTINWASLLLCTGALIATFRFEIGMIKVLSGSAALGAAIVLGLR